MIKLEKPVVVKFKNNVDIKWLPAGVELEKMYSVVAIKTIIRKDRSDKPIEDLLFGIINSADDLVFIASFNCNVFSESLDRKVV
jgi:hypothetical protein